MHHINGRKKKKQRNVTQQCYDNDTAVLHHTAQNVTPLMEFYVILINQK